MTNNFKNANQRKRVMAELNRGKNRGISEKMMQLADPEKNGTIVVERKYGIHAEIGTPLIGKISVGYQKDVVSIE